MHSFMRQSVLLRFPLCVWFLKFQVPGGILPRSTFEEMLLYQLALNTKQYELQLHSICLVIADV